MSFTVVKICELVGGTLRGDGAGRITAALPLADAGPESVTFLADRRQFARLAQCRAGAVFATADLPPASIPTIVVANPFEAMLRVAAEFQAPAPQPIAGINPRASVDPSAKIGAGASIGPFAVIEAGVVVGAGCVLHPHAVVRAGCVLGDGVEIHPHAVLYPNTIVGDRTVIHAGAVVGRDGFGYRFRDGHYHKVPQLGCVRIGDDVEIGANTTIDRATFGATSVGEGTKIDNLVQIGHNCRVGADNILVAHVGIGGSSTTGDRVTLAGKVGVADHITIGDGAVVGASSGVMNDVPAGERQFGTPSRPDNVMRRIWVLFDRLPQMRKELAEVRRAVGLHRERGDDLQGRRKVG